MWIVGKQSSPASFSARHPRTAVVFLCLAGLRASCLATAELRHSMSDSFWRASWRGKTSAEPTKFMCALRTKQAKRVTPPKENNNIYIYCHNVAKSRVTQRSKNAIKSRRPTCLLALLFQKHFDFIPWTNKWKKFTVSVQSNLLNYQGHRASLILQPLIISELQGRQPQTCCLSVNPANKGHQKTHACMSLWPWWAGDTRPEAGWWLRGPAGRPRGSRGWETAPPPASRRLKKRRLFLLLDGSIIPTQEQGGKKVTLWLQRMRWVSSATVVLKHQEHFRDVALWI